MIIKFSNFSDGIHHIDFDEPIKTIGLTEPFFDSVSLKIKMDKSHSQIVINGDLVAKVRLECDRCSEFYETNLSSEFRIIYMFYKQPESDDKINLYYISPETDKIDLTKDVVDYCLLSIPMKRLCREDCKGLCTTCGKNLNLGKCRCKINKTSDVWLPLQKLKKNI